MFEELLKINVNDYTESKNGLTYLSWTFGWSEFKKRCPDANYEIIKFENNLPYVYDENTGYMVFTKVTDGKEWKEMWLPVMDGNNKSMLNHSYTYKVKKYEQGQWTGEYIEKTVEPATMFDINKTIMRCLVKNIAMFGLGLYIYSGEDLPEGYEISKEEAEKMIVPFGKYKDLTLKEIKEKDSNYLNWIIDSDIAKQSLKDACCKLVTPVTEETIDLTMRFQNALVESGQDLDKILEHYKVKKLEDLTIEQKEEAIKIMHKKMNK